MSRSGYSDECENLALWRGAVVRAIRGKRGQRALRETAEALDAMPVKRLAANSFSRDGEVCTLGALAAHRGVDVTDLEPDRDPHDGYTEQVDRDLVGGRLDIAGSMAAEVMYENDEYYGPETPEERWQRMRAWVSRQLGQGQGGTE